MPLEYNSCHREAICTSMTELANSVFEIRGGKPELHNQPDLQGE
jgi:hypothetical protein